MGGGRGGGGGGVLFGITNLRMSQIDSLRSPFRLRNATCSIKAPRLPLKVPPELLMGEKKIVHTAISTDAKLRYIFVVTKEHDFTPIPRLHFRRPVIHVVIILADWCRCRAGCRAEAEKSRQQRSCRQQQPSP